MSEQTCCVSQSQCTDTGQTVVALIPSWLLSDRLATGAPEYLWDSSAKTIADSTWVEVSERTCCGSRPQCTDTGQVVVALISSCQLSDSVAIGGPVFKSLISSSSVVPALSLGFTIFGEIFVYVTAFRSNHSGSHILSLWMVHAGCVFVGLCHGLFLLGFVDDLFPLLRLFAAGKTPRKFQSDAAKFTSQQKKQSKLCDIGSNLIKLQYYWRFDKDLVY